MQSDLLSTRQVADRLGASVRTVHRWVEAGKLTEAHKVEGLRGPRLFEPAEIERFEREREVEAAS